MSRQKRPHQIPNQTQTNETSLQIAEEMSFSVPMPPPSILRQYNEVIPNFAKELYKDVKTEQQHRRSCDAWLVKGGTLRGLFGQVSALVIALSGLWIAWDLARNGQPEVAGVIATVDLVGLVSVFLVPNYLSFLTEKSKPPNPDN